MDQHNKSVSKLDQDSLMENLWRPYFSNIQISLESIDLLKTDSFLNKGEVYQFNFSQQANFLALSSSSSKFFAEQIAKDYQGELALILEEYFLRRVCFVLQECGKQIKNAQQFTFVGQSSLKSADDNKALWKLLFTTSKTNLAVTISASPSLAQFLTELADRLER